MSKNANLIQCELKPEMVAFARWCERHPFAIIHELKIHNGVPSQSKVRTEDGIGYDIINFVKAAEEQGLLPD